jgi:hypothetical protein
MALLPLSRAVVTYISWQEKDGPRRRGVLAASVAWLVLGVILTVALVSGAMGR